MSLLVFPTVPRPVPGCHTGLPLRAPACKCERPLHLASDPDTCVYCGHYPAETIDRTWQERAQVLMLPSRPRAQRELVAA